MTHRGADPTLDFVMNSPADAVVLHIKDLAARLAVVADERDGLLTIRHQFAEENTRLHARLASAEAWRDYYRAKWLGDRAVPQPEPPADSANEVQK